MALTITSNFNGDYALAIYEDLAEGNEVIQGNKWSDGAIAYLELDVPDKRELRNASQTPNPIGAYVTSPTGVDTTVSTTIDKRELNMQLHMIYEEFTPESYDFEWEDLRSIGSQTEHMMSPKLFATILRLLVPNAGAQISNNFFMGDIVGGAAGVDLFDGIVTKAIADANTLAVTPAGAITSVNIITILQAVIDEIPDKDYNDDSYKILISVADWRILQRVNTDTKKTSDGVLNDTMKNLIEEKKIIPYVGLAKDYIVATKVGGTADSNLHFGFWFDEMKEFQDIRVDRVAANSDAWFMRVNIKLDANYKYSENLIYYSPI